MSARLVHAVDGCEVWHGDCLDRGTAEIVLAGRSVDLYHADAPYSAKTHEGQEKQTRSINGFAGNTVALTNYAAKIQRGEAGRSELDYAAWGADQVNAVGSIWLPHVTGWATTITDFQLAPIWTAAFEESERYAFLPLPWVELGSRVRLTGDGPSCWTCWLVVARPRTKPWSKWGTLPGAYIGPAENHQNRPERITGGKSLPMTLSFLGDYSKRGDLVLDTNLGGGTTALASRMSGRRCIGIEADHERAELCARLLGTKREQISLGL